LFRISGFVLRILRPKPFFPLLNGVVGLMAATDSHITRKNILGVDFDLIDYETVLSTIRSWKRKGRREYISITNPHSVLMCHRDKRMNEATAKAALTLPDGVGIILAANLLGYDNCGRITGPMLMLKLCDLGRKYGLRHFFYGGSAGTAARLAAKLTKKYPKLQVAGVCCPPFRTLSEPQDCEFIEEINSSKPDIVWIGLGAPKQEIWMADHLGRVDTAAMIGVGAAFDFHSGNTRWAPGWIRNAGLEWIWRFAHEPKRMWRRNLDSPLFLARVIRQRFMTPSAVINKGRLQ